mgnify:CR=1 FL=1
MARPRGIPDRLVEAVLAEAGAGKSTREISAWLPLTNAVELVRPMFMDQWPQEPARNLLVLAAYTVAGFWFALALTRRRFRA